MGKHSHGHSHAEDPANENLISHSHAKKKKKENHNHEDSPCDGKTVAFVAIGLLTILYVIAELGAAIYVKSLVLLSDGFHNLSDAVSLYIAYWAQKASKRESSSDMSYGWRRTEILGGLTNGCFLLSLCLYVVLECIPKFIEPQPIEGGYVFMITAGTGLLINTIGTIVFCITGQGHGHSHSHGHGHGHGYGHKEKKDESTLVDVQISQGSESNLNNVVTTEKKKKKKKKRDMNVHAVFLHFLGDAISSLMVLAAGVLIHFFQGTWTHYIDPVSSLIIVSIILFTTIPLVKRCSVILLQGTPSDIDADSIKIHLLKVRGIVSVHDFHIWQLVDGMVITSVHIGVEEGSEFTQIVNEVRRILHEYGIHSSSIQPEFVPRTQENVEFCEQNCVQNCDEDWCCKETAEKRKRHVSSFSISSEL